MRHHPCLFGGSLFAVSSESDEDAPAGVQLWDKGAVTACSLSRPFLDAFLDGSSITSGLARSQVHRTPCSGVQPRN